VCALVNWKILPDDRVDLENCCHGQPAARFASVVAALAISHWYHDYTRHIRVLNTWVVFSEDMCIKQDLPPKKGLPSIGILQQQRKLQTQ